MERAAKGCGMHASFVNSQRRIQVNRRRLHKTITIVRAVSGFATGQGFEAVTRSKKPAQISLSGLKAFWREEVPGLPVIPAGQAVSTGAPLRDQGSVIRAISSIPFAEESLLNSAFSVT